MHRGLVPFALALAAMLASPRGADAEPEKQAAPAPATPVPTTPAPTTPPSPAPAPPASAPVPAAGEGEPAPAPTAGENEDETSPTPAEPPLSATPPPPDDGKRALRRRDLSVARIFRGPFSTSRLFSMPTADVIGAYMLTLSGDASLLQETGFLTSGGVVSIGFGDIAQLEYRHTSAISITGVNAPLPAVGVQLKVPIPEHRNVPAFGVAFRLGVPRTEQLGDTVIEEAVTDLYLVGRLRFEFAPWLTLHGGARISSARIELSGDRTGSENTRTDRRLTLPTGGYEIAMNKDAKIVGELALAPRFKFMPGADTRPEIGYGMLGRLGLRWSVTPSVIIDGSINYQTEVGRIADVATLDAIVQWDIRLGAEVFVPWGALACRAVGVFCD